MTPGPSEQSASVARVREAKRASRPKQSGDGRSSTRVLVATALLLAVVVGIVPATTAAAGETTAQPTTTAADPPQIIPEPNSGTEPQDAGDRGGALQTALFGAIVLALVGIGLVVVRQSRRARAERGF